jgi:hypothetical protein
MGEQDVVSVTIKRLFPEVTETLSESTSVDEATPKIERNHLFDNIAVPAKKLPSMV